MIFSIPALFFMYSCTTSGLETPCTLEQRVLNMTILTPDGEPADSVEIVVSNKETGESYQTCKKLYGDDCYKDGADGTYAIFADGVEEGLDKGEKIFTEVVGKKEDLSFNQDYTVGYDGCHVYKAAGPDTVSLK